MLRFGVLLEQSKNVEAALALLGNWRDCKHSEVHSGKVVITLNDNERQLCEVLGREEHSFPVLEAR